MVFAFTLLTVLLCSAAQAAAPEYGFDWSSPSSKCQKMSPALTKGYKCAVPEAGSASGHKHRMCTAPDKKKEFLIFSTEAQCREELETQRASQG